MPCHDQDRPLDTRNIVLQRVEVTSLLGSSGESCVPLVLCRPQLPEVSPGPFFSAERSEELLEMFSGFSCALCPRD